MKAFLISLRDSSRLQGTLASLASFGIQPEVRLGVRGTQIPRELLDEMVFHHPLRKYLVREITPGELGCSISHYLVMNHIVQRNIRRAFIFEDDVRFSHDPTETIVALESWAETQHNFILNWGGQKDPRFSLPISEEVHRSETPAFSVLRFSDMPWYTHCLFVDRAYCIERLSKALPVVYIFDVYGALDLNSSFLVLKEERLTCDPELAGDTNPSMIGHRNPSLVSRVLPRNTMARLFVERLRDRMLRKLAGPDFWPLERTQAYLDGLQRLSEVGFSSGHCQ